VTRIRGYATVGDSAVIVLESGVVTTLTHAKAGCLFLQSWKSGSTAKRLGTCALPRSTVDVEIFTRNFCAFCVNRIINKK